MIGHCWDLEVGSVKKRMLEVKDLWVRVEEKMVLKGINGERELNLGFSGGEPKRSEILKLMAQNPQLFMLDEPESGVDLENIAVIARAIKTMLQKDQVIKKRTASGIIITHTGYILEYVEADIGHVFLDGKIVCSGNPREIFA